jgi:soluble lytic murein transglycosylase
VHRYLQAHDADADPSVLSLRAELALAAGEVDSAGRLFGRAATATAGVTSAAFSARAAQAFAEGGSADSAAWYFDRAANGMPEIRSWLLVHRAEATPDPTRALALLDRAEGEAAAAAHRVRGSIWLAVGDTARALGEFERGGALAAATQAAVALGDTAAALRIASLGVRSADTAIAHETAVVWERQLGVRSVSDALAIADVWRRLRAPEAVVRVLGVVMRTAGADSSAGYWRTLGDARAGAGRLRDALSAYDRAAAIGGAEGVSAEYLAARTQIRVGSSLAGYRALTRFVARHPTHPRAALAQYAVADWHLRAGRGRVADSVFRDIARRWPHDPYADRAREALARRAIQRGDTSAALGWYASEIVIGTGDADAARYFLGEILAATHDSARALRELRELASEDSLGYWGTRARKVLGLPEPHIAVPTPPSPTAAVRRLLERLDLLCQAGLDDDARVLLRDAMARSDWGPSDMLALGSALVSRGWIREGIRLGVRAGQASSFTEPPVLELLYPWPFRAAIEREALEHHVDPYLIAALVRQESSFVPDAVSRAGAQGLMQLLPATARGVASRLGVEWEDRWIRIPDANLHLGTAHLAALLRAFDGDVVLALAAFNAGSRPVRAWQRAAPKAGPVRFVEEIPYSETRDYLHVVLRNWMLYRALYASGPDTDAAGP